MRYKLVEHVRVNYIVLLAFALFNLWYWQLLVLDHPIDFWGIGLDSPVMSLSHAINLDYWFSNPGHRVVSQPQTYHPGMFYQIISFLIYKITFWGSCLNFNERLNSVLSNPSTYWGYIQIVPLLVTLVSFFLLFHYNKKLNPFVLIASLLSLYSLSSTLRFAIYDLFNESLVFLFVTIFYIYTTRYFNKDGTAEENSAKNVIVYALISSFLYLNKMNYILMALPVGFILVADAFFIKRSKNSIKKLLLYSFLTPFFVLFFAFLIFGGIRGVGEMLIHHKDLIMASGHYGSGPRNLVNLGEVVSAVSSIYQNEYYFSITFLIIASLLIIKIIINLKRKGADEGLVILCGLILMLAGILKHFIPYYLVSVVVIFPSALIYALREGMKYQKVIALLLIPFFLYALTKNSQSQFNSRVAEQAYASAVESDCKAITNEFPLQKNENRFWMYRITCPQFQRNFIVEFTSIPQFQGKIVAIQGREFQFSPWSDDVIYQNDWTKLSKVKWNYLVADKDGLKYLNKDVHGHWFNSTKIKSKEYSKLVIYYE